jgi:hypothetical protein
MLAWGTKRMPAAVSLIEPIFNAQLESERRSRVIAMDETPIKAGAPAQALRLIAIPE